MKEKIQSTTPLMQQYQKIKVDFPDTLLFFQVGDFYELFFNDAQQAAAFLGIALTARGTNKGEPIPLCGVPVHAKDHYINKLVKGGFKVAICSQLSEPRPGSIVQRGVTQVLTPGTLTDSILLDDKSASYLFSFFPTKDQWGLLFGELLTAQLFATVLPVTSEKNLESELIRFFPDEILLPDNKSGKQFQSHFKQLGYFTTLVSSQCDVQDEAREWVVSQFKESIQIKTEQNASLQAALFSFYAYVRRNQASALSQFNTINFYQPEDFLLLDASTQRNLELVRNMHDGTRKNTLFSVIDQAKTAMGSRMIKKWILRPLVKKEAIEQRQDVIECLIRDVACMQELELLFSGLGDVERIVGRIAINRAQLHDYSLLAVSIKIIPKIKALLKKFESVFLCTMLHEYMGDFFELAELLSVSLNDDPAKEWIIKSGFDAELDRLRELVYNAHKKIIALERQEQEKTGIQSLKICYNRVQGYFIEVTKKNSGLVPDYYKRHQTLAGKERYLIIPLQELEHDINKARNEIDAAEKMVFERVKLQISLHVISLRKSAHALSYVDALLGLSRIASYYKYVRPLLNESQEICIKQGRHPVVESVLKSCFIPNDTCLNTDESLWIITGPNMGGKSTYLRQVALITVLAHIGSFVPAEKADIALLDRIFTRIGAGDNVAQGKSTFLVEMEETATICTQATKNSLIILDEVGRGTSTFDGLAIAHAVVEYLHTQVQARCLFATHYHELTQLRDTFPGIVCYYMLSKKTVAGILFLHKIIKGVSLSSFGIDVAQLAQLPESVVKRARELIINFSVPHASFDGTYQENKDIYAQLKVLEQAIEKNNSVIHSLYAIDYDNLSPKKAFDLLWDLKEKLQ